MDSVKNVSRLLSNEISGTRFYLSSPALNSRHFFVFRFAGLSMDGSRTFAARFLFLCPQKLLLHIQLHREILHLRILSQI